MAFKRDDIFPAVAATSLLLLLAVVIAVALGLMWAEEKTAAILTALVESPLTTVIGKACVTGLLLCALAVLVLIVKDTFRN